MFAASWSACHKARQAKQSQWRPGPCSKESTTGLFFQTQAAADTQKLKFGRLRGFPNVFGCIDGTHVRILRPTDNEFQYVNRKNFHSINVQVSTVSWYNPLLPQPVVAAARYCRDPFFLFYSLSFSNVCVCVCVCYIFSLCTFFIDEKILHKEKGRPPAEVFDTSAGIGTRNPVHWRQAWWPVVVNLPGSFVRLSRYSRTMSKLVAAITGCGNNGPRQ